MSENEIFKKIFQIRTHLVFEIETLYKNKNNKHSSAMQTQFLFHIIEKLHYSSASVSHHSHTASRKTSQFYSSCNSGLKYSSCFTVEYFLWLFECPWPSGTVSMVKAPCLTPAKNCLDGTVNLGICFLPWKFYIFISGGGKAEFDVVTLD